MTCTQNVTTETCNNITFWCLSARWSQIHITYTWKTKFFVHFILIYLYVDLIKYFKYYKYFYKLFHIFLSLTHILLYASELWGRTLSRMATDNMKSRTPLFSVFPSLTVALLSFIVIFPIPCSPVTNTTIHLPTPYILPGIGASFWSRRPAKSALELTRASKRKIRHTKALKPMWLHLTIVYSGIPILCIDLKRNRDYR